MLYQSNRKSNRLSQPWHTLVERLEKPLTGLFVTLGLVVVGLPNGSVLGSDLSVQKLNVGQKVSGQMIGKSAGPVSDQPVALVSGQPVGQSAEQSPQTQDPRSLADGVYLYGQAPEPEQVGAAYMVFEVKQGNVVGAFYMPRSSFDCFSGRFESDRLALTVVDSYEQTPYPYAIALDSTNSVAMAGGETIAPVGLEGFQRLAQLSSNDQRILSTCKADHPNPASAQ